MKVDITSSPIRGRIKMKKQIHFQSVMSVMMGNNAISPRALKLNSNLPERVGQDEAFLTPKIIVDFAQVGVGDHGERIPAKSHQYQPYVH